MNSDGRGGNRIWTRGRCRVITRNGVCLRSAFLFVAFQIVGATERQRSLDIGEADVSISLCRFAHDKEVQTLILVVVVYQRQGSKGRSIHKKGKKRTE